MIRLILTCIFLLFLAGLVHAQDPIGGPYEPDSATVLLMHFDGDLQNETDRTADGNAFGDTEFVEDSLSDRYGKQLQLNYGPELNESRVQIPDTSALDLTGNWTIELWIRIDYINDQLDYTPPQSILVKPHEMGADINYDETPTFNYRMGGNWTARSYFSSYTDTSRNYISTSSDKHVWGLEKWRHVTFVRDTSKQIIAKLVHADKEYQYHLPQKEDSLKLLSFETYDYGSEGKSLPPQVSDHPLFIGATPHPDTISRRNIDGQVDELRISNTVRNFAVPPAFSKVTKLTNQPAGISYPVEATIKSMGDSHITNAMLHYRVDQGEWQSLSMTNASGCKYEARIPSQPLGSRIDYYLTSTNNYDRQATYPKDAREQNKYYTFGVWRDSTKVLDINFEERMDGQAPADQSIFDINLSYHGSVEPSYSPGLVGKALRFNRMDSTYLKVLHPLLELDSFMIDMTFQVQDTITTAEYLINKIDYREGGHRDHNYHIQFYDIYEYEGHQLLASAKSSAVTIPNRDPTHFAKKNTWYRVVYGYRADTTFARLYDPQNDSLIANVGEAIDDKQEESHYFFTPLYIGARAPNSRLFNGLIDNIEIYNYVPVEYLPKTVDKKEPTDNVPRQISLHENYPNPFNPTTQIEFSLPQAADVNLTVYDVLGRRVATLVDGKRQAGKHSVSFDASNLSSGVYLYRLRADGVNKSRKMLLVK